MDPELGVAILFYCAVAIQIVFWGLICMRLLFYRSPKVESSRFPVSVIICARNEAGNLERFLPLVLTQDYPQYEVIVVNDMSTDNTAEVLEGMKKSHPHLKVLHLDRHPKEIPGKKYPLSKGIEIASFEHLLMTDADCAPASDKWISTMMAGYKEGAEIILGYGPYLPEKGMVNKFTRLETVYSAIQYFSLTLWGMPYMAVGRNLSYLKSLYRKADGFKRHENVISGDDDLFMRDAANPFNVNSVIRPEAFTYSLSKRSWREYFRQKNRHISTSNLYKPTVKLVLILLSLSHFLFFLTFSCGMVFHFSVAGLMKLALLRCLTTYAVYGVILTKWKEKGLIAWVPVFELSLILYFIFLSPLLLVRKKTPWK